MRPQTQVLKMLKPDQIQAAKSLLRLIESNPLELSAYCKLADLYGSAGEHQKANLTLRRVLEIDPFHHEAWIRLGIHHMNRGEWRDAADAFERATEISPMEASGWIGAEWLPLPLKIFAPHAGCAIRWWRSLPIAPKRM